MRKKIVYIGIVILLMLMNITKVQASSLKMNIELPEEYINLTQLVESDPDQLEKYQLNPQELKNKYQKNGIMIDAINEEKSKTITAMVMGNLYTSQIQSMSKLSKEELTNWMEEYKQVKQKDMPKEIVQRSYVVNDKIYVNTRIMENNAIIQDEYYTIEEGKAIIISLNRISGEIQEGEMEGIVNNITFNDIQIELPQSMYIITTITIVVSVCILIMYEILKRKNKIEIKENEKEKLTKKVIENYELKKNMKLGGYQLFFLITVILSILNMGYQTIQSFITGEIGQKNGLELIYLIVTIIQNILQIIVLGYIGLLIPKKATKAKKQIEKALIITMSFVIIGTLIKTGLSYQMGIVRVSYYSLLLVGVIQNIIYLILWYTYYKNSIRVSIYYLQNSMQELVQNPTTKIQKARMETRLVETKIVTFFEERNAIELKNAVEIQEIPREFIKSFYLSRLARRKVLKVKEHKVYLNKKRKTTRKYERIREAKIIGVILFVYIIIILIVKGL